MIHPSRQFCDQGDDVGRGILDHLSPAYPLAPSTPKYFAKKWRWRDGVLPNFVTSIRNIVPNISFIALLFAQNASFLPCFRPNIARFRVRQSRRKSRPGSGLPTNQRPVSRSRDTNDQWEAGSSCHVGQLARALAPSNTPTLIPGTPVLNTFRLLKPSHPGILTKYTSQFLGPWDTLTEG